MRAAAFVTLTRGLEVPTKAKQLASAVFMGNGQREQETRILLEEALPRLLRVESQHDTAKTKRLLPLEPDLLGERLLVHVVTRPDLDGDIFGPGIPLVQPANWFPHALEVDPSGTLQTLLLMAQDFPTDNATLAWGEGLLNWLLQRGHPSGTDSAQEMALALHVPTIIVTLAQGGARLPKKMWDDLLSYARQNAFRWRSAVIAFVTSLPTVLERAPEASGFHAFGYRLIDSRPDDWREWHRVLPGAAVNAIAHYGSAQRWDDLEQWGKTLTGVADQFPEEKGIQFALATAAFNAIYHYGTAQRWDDLERWGETLTGVAAAFAGDKEIQFLLAKGAVNAITGYGTAQRWDDLERWGAKLARVADKFPQDRKAQLALANGAVNSIDGYGTAQRWNDLERWGKTLTGVADQFPKDKEIQLELAKGAVNAIIYYGRAQRWDNLEQWGKTLTGVAAKFPEAEDVQLRLAKGAASAITGYGRGRVWDGLERWGRVLTEVADTFTEDNEIQLELAKGAASAIFCYGIGDEWNSLGFWSERLCQVLPSLDIDAQLFESFVELSTTLALGKRHVAALLVLMEYWPGFLWGPHFQEAPLPFVIYRLADELGLSEDQRVRVRDTALRVSRYLTRYEEVRSAAKEGRMPDVETVRALWRDRMCSPDRGDSLLPLLKQLQLSEELQEYEQDPWRR